MFSSSRFTPPHAMRTGLDHLPERKRRELHRLVELILESTREARATRKPVRVGAFSANASELKDPQLIILFGSHARGDWVDEKFAQDGITYTYRSDFDILIITPTAELARYLGVWKRVIERAGQPLAASHDTRSDDTREVGEGPTPVTIIDHPLSFVNQKVREHHHFFCDVLREGIVLHSAGDYKLAEPPELDPKERQQFAQKSYDKWVGLADDCFMACEYMLGQDRLNYAAFNLHQAAEHLYGAILLVFDGYKPRTHRLDELNRRAASADTEFLYVFPLQTDDEQRRFQLLCAAYVDARYEDTYTITREDLEYLAERVRHLRLLTEHACTRKIRKYVSA